MARGERELYAAASSISGTVMASSYTHFGVLGAGAWGTALAIVLKRAGRDVTLWARDSALAAQMASKRENITYLPGIPLAQDLRITHDLKALSPCHALVLAVPAQHLRAICKELAPHCGTLPPIIIAAKGIELGTYRLMSEIAVQEMPGHPIFVLSGPSFAKEIAKDLPAALTLASESEGETLAHAMSSPLFRLYTTDDIIGTQIGGAVKNVLAIACGIVAGRSLGENARAALITRGLAEMIRLGIALGARAETLMGLSGLGDVVLTCSSKQSRNTSLGYELGQGKNLADILAGQTCVFEGVATATAVLGLARRHGIDMPVVSAIDMILRDRASIDDSVAGLLARPLRNEAI